MIKKMYSGNFPMGICGEETDLTDSFGERLYTGDLVGVWCEEYKRDLAEYGPEYVVDPDHSGPFIMGLRGPHKRVTEYYLDGEEATEDEYDHRADYYISQSGEEYRWFVKKIKSYEDTVDGEKWGSGNVTVREIEEAKE